LDAVAFGNNADNDFITATEQMDDETSDSASDGEREADDMPEERERLMPHISDNKQSSPCSARVA
jgi:hypothetical protein